VDELTAYESGQVGEIAAWKAGEPGRVSRALKRVRGPLGRLVGDAVPGAMVRKMAETAGALVDTHDGLQEIAREAGVGDVGELRYRPLEECDRLARAVSTQGQKLALRGGAAAGPGGFVTEPGSIALLLAAAERAIRRIGHCYGYRLDTEAERRFVLGVLELSAVDDPAERCRLGARLTAPAALGPKPGAPGLNGVKKGLLDDLVQGAVPLLPGDATSVALDYAFVRRVDVTARRVFQERWLRDRGKVAEVPAAPSPGRRAFRRHAAGDLVCEAVHLGGFGVGFAVGVPVAVAGALASRRLPAPVVRGAAEGARDAAASAAQFAAGWRSLPGHEGVSPARPVGLSAG